MKSEHNLLQFFIQGITFINPISHRSTEEGDVDIVMGDEATAIRHNDTPNHTLKRHVEEMDVSEENNHVEEAPIFKKANLTNKADHSHRSKCMIRRVFA